MFEKPDSQALLLFENERTPEAKRSLAVLKNPASDLPDWPTTRQCGAKVVKVMIKRGSWLRSSGNLNPDSLADAANVRQALHSQWYSNLYHIGGVQPSSRSGSVFALLFLDMGIHEKEKKKSKQLAMLQLQWGAPSCDSESFLCTIPSCKVGWQLSLMEISKLQQPFQAGEQAVTAVLLDTLSSPPPPLANACRASSTFQGNVKLLSKHYTPSQTHAHIQSVRE